jgi:DNA-binding NarL/FixJ family response regulator
MTRPRILLADDHAMLLEAFKALLEPEFDVVGTVTDGRMLLTECSRLNPDVVLLDIAMPLLNGLDAARQLKQTMPDLRIVFLTMNEDPDLAAEAFRAGASGYLLKRSAAAELRTALHEVSRRRSYITPLMTEGLVSSMLNRNESGGPATRVLTSRQREIVQLLAEGRSMKGVASVLNITPRTVAFHKYRIMAQLRVKTTAELIQYAIKHSII